MITYTVMTQADGCTPEAVGRFDTEAEALAKIAKMGGEMDAPLTIPEDNGGTTTAYNLGPNEGCPIAWIEAR